MSKKRLLKTDLLKSPVAPAFVAFLILGTLFGPSEVFAAQADNNEKTTYGIFGECFEGFGKDKTYMAYVELKLFLVDSLGKKQTLVGSTKSDMGGGFEFEGLIDPGEKDYESAKYVLLGRLPGYATVRFRESSWLRTKNEFKIQLAKAGRLSGKVIDEKGNPVEGLTVFNGISMVEPVEGFTCTKTGLDGKFELTDVETPPPPKDGRRRSTMLRGLHPNYGRFNLMLSDISKPVEIKLRPASKISGRVLEAESGKAKADCLVVASLARSSVRGVQIPGGRLEPASWLTARTNEKGEYNFSLFANAKYNIFTYKTKKWRLQLPLKPVCYRKPKWKMSSWLIQSL